MSRKAGGEGFGQHRLRSFVSVPPAAIRAVRYISSPRYLEGDRGLTKRGEVRARKPNLQFTASVTVLRGDFRKHEVLHMAASRSIKVGKELFGDYGEKFVF